MTTCTVRWRPSGGRGEFEYVPADSLLDRVINLYFEPLDVTIPAEIMGIKAQGKPRLRKFEPNNRQKSHLPQLVMAVARMPEPRRQDLSSTVAFPLENKGFVLDAMHFDVIEDDSETATLAPLRASILHSAFEIDLQDRFKAIAADLADVATIRVKHPELADAIQIHGNAISEGRNSKSIRDAADRIIELQSAIFGQTNVGSALKLQEAEAYFPAEIEGDFVGKEGRLLTRIHSYRERDRSFASMAKKYYRIKHGGHLLCEACGLDPIAKYGSEGERCIEAHHKIPIEQLQPDSITRVEDMAMVCASCHKIIHIQKPCLTVEEVRERVALAAS